MKSTTYALIAVAAIAAFALLLIPGIVRSLWHAQRHAVQVCYQRVPLPGTPVS
ncbi:Uncharacterised protein [Klebsiella pneumoniae]|nr:Uncharacterised protein [Klebsiella pneumoniae]